MEDSKQNKIVLLRQMIENAERNISGAKQILQQMDSASARKSQMGEGADNQVIEGTFDGEKMIGMDGKKYPVPVNYASKSKLVEGDLLKLTITEDGSFVYKQISPIDRRKIIGTLMKDGKGKYYISAEQRKYKVLLASVTYFKAKEGDEVILVVPKEKISKWGAIEALMDESSEQDREEFLEAERVPKRGQRKSDEEDLITEENRKENIIEDEWTPDIEEIKKEAKLSGSKEEGEEGEISNDLSKE